MNILHLTDFHFKTSLHNEFKQDAIVENIVNHIKKQNILIDYIFFTGDLVFSGTKSNDFTNAAEVLIDKLLSALNIPKDRFFICPGNHDVDRTKVSPAIISRIDNLKTNEELEAFVKKKDIDYQSSLSPLENYEHFAKQYFTTTNRFDTISFGYSSHIRTHLGKSVGVICLNTAWRAIGDLDEGNLIVPISYLQESLKLISKCDIKILLHHHPISQFKLYNQYTIEDLIHNNFNVSFSGHLHKNNTSVSYTSKDGILKLASAAALADNDGSKIGFTIVNINLDSFKVNATCYKYDAQDEIFYDTKPLELQIPIDSEKAKQNKFRQRLRALYSEELENADDLFLKGKKDKDNKGFIDLWTSPVISSKSAEEVKKQNSVKIVEVEQIIKSNVNFLIMGNDKCGKTSLLKKIQLICLEDYNHYERIPIYLDFKKIEKEEHLEGKFVKDLASYFQVNKAAVKDIMENETVMLLIDNMDFRDDENIKWLEGIVKSFSLAQIIICTDQNSGSKYQELKINTYSVKTLYFHSLKPKQLRELADKFYGSSEISKVEVINRINHIFGMLAIPFNFWSVSLFLWVFKDSRKDITNDVDLVDLYIESILEREKLIKNKGSFSFEKYKQYLAHLSKFLLDNNENAYSATSDNILEFTAKYLASNPRNDTDSATIWSYITDKGIIKEVENKRYAFRLNGVFEYFLAHYLKLDKEFRETVINDNNVYLSFKNELEMYAGSNRGDEDFVLKIFNKTKEIFAEINQAYLTENIDNALTQLDTGEIALHLEKNHTDLIRSVMSNEQLDDIEEVEESISTISIQDNCEVRLKRFLPIDQNNIVSLENSLYILGRVFKNADDITSTDLINEIFDYIIDTTVSWGYKLFQSFNSDNSGLSEEKNKMAALVKLMRQMLPIIVQSRISDMIGANNLQGIIKDKLHKLKTSKEESQFKKFILLYTLADIDLLKNHEYIKQSISDIKIPVLRYSILVKILYYYNFRTLEYSPSNKEKISKTLQGYFAEAGPKFNSKLYTKDSVSKTFQTLEKLKTVNAKLS
ncbi:hypothetical protein CA265_10460 [Sphingobacteriaceae bacterium GW460-11-11-14-LB5]|nr:hypothetical protein CA265_10460 [Sphingobacteriaceae bacterium GW460-11-11-14-LB5]